MKVLIYSNTFYLISGGDVIYANLGRKFHKDGHGLKIVTNENGRLFCLGQGIRDVCIIVQRSSWVDFLPLFFVELYKTLISTIREIFANRNKPDVIFSSSFFLPDIIPAVIEKIKNPHAKLIVGVYLPFPSPLSFKKYHGGQIKLLFLYLSQQISLFLIHRFANLVLTASQKDTNLFASALAIRGGIDFHKINKTKKQKKKFDLVYFGRFHSQKGIIDLLDIWKWVKEKRPRTNFLMVGAGPLQHEIVERSKHLGIYQDITFTGVLKGAKKYKTLCSARLFTSASRFDTGNMALDETLACGVPGVVYDIDYLDYQSGVIKIPLGKKHEMAKAILKILDDKDKIKEMGLLGKRFIRNFDWGTTFQKISSLLMS